MSAVRLSVILRVTGHDTFQNSRIKETVCKETRKGKPKGMVRYDKEADNRLSLTLQHLRVTTTPYRPTTQQGRHQNACETTMEGYLNKKAHCLPSPGSEYYLNLRGQTRLSENNVRIKAEDPHDTGITPQGLGLIRKLRGRARPSENNVEDMELQNGHQQHSDFRQKLGEIRWTNEEAIYALAKCNFGSYRLLMHAYTTCISSKHAGMCKWSRTS